MKDYFSGNQMLEGSQSALQPDFLPLFLNTLFHSPLSTPATFIRVSAPVLDSSMSLVWPLHDPDWGAQCT